MSKRNWARQRKGGEREGEALKERGQGRLVRRQLWLVLLFDVGLTRYTFALGASIHDDPKKQRRMLAHIVSKLVSTETFKI